MFSLLAGADGALEGADSFVNDDRVFVCDARIDNRDELGSDLSDSALFAAAYDKWGERCVDKVIGDFAFAAWHRHENKVVAAVDPLGNRRLFYARIGNGLALSTQLASLLAHPGVDRMTDIAQSRRFFDRLAAPKRMVVLDGASHMPTEHPGVDQLEAAVLDFLGKLAPMPLEAAS